MKKIFRRSSVFIALGAAVAIPAVSGIPAQINNESSAKAALVVPIHVFQTVPTDLLYVTGGAQRVAQFALNRLNAVATPAQLTASSAGIEVDCPHAGKFLARAAAPDTIALTFTDCARETEGLVWDMTGVAEIVLSASSFAPNSVASIRLGNAEQDLLEKFYSVETPESYSLWSRNLRVVGRIPVERDEPDFGYYGPFTYNVTGFSEQAHTTHAPDGTAGKFGLRYASENLVVNGHRNEWWLGNVQVFDFVFNFTSGNLSQTFFDTLAAVSETRTDTFDALKVSHRVVSQGNNNIASLSIDGAVDITWRAGHGAGCVSGTYVMHTPQPLVFINDTGSYAPDDGELRINDNLVARFSAVPQTTIRVNVRNVGNFRYHESITAVAASVPCAP